jgi:hypothetical protein
MLHLEHYWGKVIVTFENGDMTFVEKRQTEKL